MRDHGSTRQRRTPGLRAAPETVAAALGLTYAGTDVRTARVRVHGWTAAVVCQLNREEHERRTAADPEGRPESLADWGSLNLLMAFPHEEAVSLRGLSPRERELLARLPDWTRTIHSGHVWRHVRPPLRPLLAVIPAVRWADGLAASREYTGFCATAVTLDAPLADPFAPLDAAESGIGLIVGEDLAVPAVPPMRVRHNATSWWFAEHAYWDLQRRSVRRRT